MGEATRGGILLIVFWSDERLPSAKALQRTMAAAGES